MRTIEISEETFERIKEQINESEFKEINSYDDLIGSSYFFRTVTYHWIGKVVKRFGSFLELKEASWVADSGRFMNAIKEGTLDEVEPVGRAYINISSLVDFMPWVHELPKKQK